MQLMLAAQVEETTTTTGTGTLSLGGATAGNRTFIAAFGDAAWVHYTIIDGSAWEFGIGKLTDGSPDTLTRDTVLGSSASGAKLSLSAGTKLVFNEIPPGSLNNNGVTVINDNATSISVKNGHVFFINNGASTNLGSFTDGVPGQEIILIFGNHNTTLMNAGNVHNQGGFNWTPQPDDVVGYTAWMYEPTSTLNWYESSKSVN